MSTDGKSPSREQKIARLRRRLHPEGPAGRTHDDLEIDGIPVAWLAERFGTPLFVYGAGALRTRVAELTRALDGAADVYFSVKANPSLGLCQLLAAEGLGAEIASGGELVVAREAGFPMNRTLFAGPGKTDEELRRAASEDLEAVNVESFGELERLSAIGSAQGRSVRVCLRVNPRRSVGGARMRMGGGAEQFGIPEEDLPEVMASLEGLPGVQAVGVHVYVGTQMFESDALLAHCDQVLEIARTVARRLGRPLSLVDLGGGFGVPYFEGLPELDLRAFARGLSERVAAARREPHFARARFVLELGRYLVAECGVYVARVLDVKRGRGKTFAVTDGGMHHHIMATGNFGQVFRRPYPMAQVGSLRSRSRRAGQTAREEGRHALDAAALVAPTRPPGEGPETQPVTLTGPCCTPLDVLGQDVPMPPLAPGDLVGVFYSGAYGYSASSLAFLSHPGPAEVLVDAGHPHLLRPAGSFEAVLDGQRRLEARPPAGLHVPIR